MRAEIIAIGDELTTGQRLDTNSQWLAERLLEIGVPVAFHTTVGDTLADNVLVFRQACERAEIVVATGGLGPTADDLTRHALAELAGVPLVQDDASLDHIQALFSRRKREMPPANLIQALFPQGATPIHNPHGTAPGIDMTMSPAAIAAWPRRLTPAATPVESSRAARIFCLPGVPAEMKEMWTATVAPAIQSVLGVKRVIAHYRIKCFGVGESDLEAMLPDLIARDRYPLVGITVHQATITLRITAEGETPEAARASMEPTIKTIHECLGDLIFGYEEDELQDAVVRLLKERGKTLAIGDLHVDGLLSHWIGESDIDEDGDGEGTFRGAVVFTGSSRVGVIDTFTDGQHSANLDDATSAAYLAQDVRNRFAADIGLAIKGPNHPDHDPIVFYAVAIEGGVTALKQSITGHPELLKTRAAKQALNVLRLHLLKKE